jgi:lipoate-protein ligase B
VPDARDIRIERFGGDGEPATFEPVWRRQQALVDQIAAGESPETVLWGEHQPVFTLGRGTPKDEAIPDDGTPRVEIERGGSVTWHGPGQLVIYPLLKLGEGERDLHKYLRAIESAVIDTLQAHGINGLADPKGTGVWVPSRGLSLRKIASIGVAVRRWVTYHGVSLNVAPDMAVFDTFSACSLGRGIMTSWTIEAGDPPPMSAIAHELIARLLPAMGRSSR